MNRFSSGFMSCGPQREAPTGATHPPTRQRKNAAANQQRAAPPRIAPKPPERHRIAQTTAHSPLKDPAHRSDCRVAWAEPLGAERLVSIVRIFREDLRTRTQGTEDHGRR